MTKGATQLTPPATTNAIVSFPLPAVLLIRLNRPSTLNALTDADHWELHALYEWLDAEPSLACAVITGTGRAFCAGADLKEWNLSNAKGLYVALPPSGIGGLSGRQGKKPVIAAVNGLAYGGGFEMAINADMVVASESAVFALPEGRRGTVAVGGSLSRLVLTLGRQRAMEVALTGQPVTARTAHAWGLVNRIVPPGEDVVAKALDMARAVADSSPDSVIVTRKGINLAWDGLGADAANQELVDAWYPKMNKKYNMVEGVKAFSEKRKPTWVPSKI